MTFLSWRCEAPPRLRLRPKVPIIPSSTVQIPLWQRLLAPLVYLLPWSDAIPFGLGADGVFNQIPLLRLLIVPAVPLIQLDRGVPFGGLLLFFVLFLAVVRNPAADLVPATDASSLHCPQIGAHGQMLLRPGGWLGDKMPTI